MKKGFTLIELLVVVLIIGILSAIALPQYTTAVEKARSTEAITLMGNLRYAAERYRLQTGSFPGADMTVLDIELPGVTSATSGAKTKNFTITATGTGNTYTITATRVNSSGNSMNTYALRTVVSSDGSAKRYCDTKGGDGATLCNAITAGHATDGEW